MNHVKTFITSKFITWLSRSLIGNVVLAEFLIGLPTFVKFFFFNEGASEFGVRRFLLVSLVCLMEGAAFGGFIWVAVTKPSLYRVRSRSK